MGAPMCGIDNRFRMARGFGSSWCFGLQASETRDCVPSNPNRQFASSNFDRQRGSSFGKHALTSHPSINSFSNREEVSQRPGSRPIDHDLPTQLELVRPQTWKLVCHMTVMNNKLEDKEPISVEREGVMQRIASTPLHRDEGHAVSEITGTHKRNHY